ncbi:MAG TPA: hypothetical protein VHX61_02875 [Rhizomicrobium sp.]|nr:hypothetical protein [Rhizomicrobium sp.]
MIGGETLVPVQIQRRRRRLSDSWKLELSNSLGEVVAIACLVPLLLAAVIWNGFPIIYYDTGAYVFEGLGGHFMVERSPVYSLFLRYAGAGTSLWFIALLQALATAFVMTETGRAISPRLPLGLFLLIGAALVVATGLPWYVGQIEPDCFAAITVLALYLLAFQSRSLGRARSGMLAVVGGFAAASHPSLLVLTGLLLILLIAIRVLLQLSKRIAANGWPRPRLLEPVLVCLFGFALVVAGNYHFTRQMFISRAGASFVFARMLQDGIVMRLLDDTCPKSGYRLCAWRDSLPATADGWLWTPRSPFFALGHFQGTAAESERIVRDAIRRYPLMQLRAAVIDASAQFVRFGTGDQIEPQEWVLAPVFARYMPTQMEAYLAARQQRGEIDFRPISRLDVAVGFLSLGALLLMLVRAIRLGNRRTTVLLGFVLGALMGNAAICGILSGPHDRYQSRLIWLAPFAVLLALPFAPTTNDH